MKTYSQLITASKDYCVDDRTTTDSSLSSSETFIKREINNAIFTVADHFQMHKRQDLPKTMSTVADQIYYQYPIGLNTIQTATLASGSITYPLTVVNSQDKWDNIQAITVGGEIPQYIFPRKYDFGVYPTPSGVNTLTIVGNYYPTALTYSDYTTGTVAVTADSATVTGTSTAWATNVAGKMFALADSNGVQTSQWYVVSSRESTTSLTLQNVYQGSSASTQAYIIAEVPDLPEELQQYIPYRVAEIYSMTRRRDLKMAAGFGNMFWTGDLMNSSRKYGVKDGIIGIGNKYKLMGRSNSQISRTNMHRHDEWSFIWAANVT